MLSFLQSLKFFFQILRKDQYNDKLSKIFKFGSHDCFGEAARRKDPFFTIFPVTWTLLVTDFPGIIKDLYVKLI